MRHNTRFIVNAAGHYADVIAGMINDKDFSLTMEKFEEVATIAKKIIPGLRTKRTCFVFSGSRSICVETDDFWIGPSSKEKRFIRPEKRSLRRQIVKDVASGVGMIGLGAFVAFGEGNRSRHPADLQATDSGRLLRKNNRIK